MQKITSRYNNQQMKETQFALQALMEIPQQYQQIKHMNYLSRDNFSKGAYMLAQDLPCVEVYPCPQPVQHTYVAEYAVYQPSPYYAQGMGLGMGMGMGIDSNDDNNATAVPGYPVEMAPSAPSDDAVPVVAARSALQHRESNAELALNRLQEELECGICQERRKDTVFQCGHETCRLCADLLTHCPSCRVEIHVRIKRFG